MASNSLAGVQRHCLLILSKSTVTFSVSQWQISTVPTITNRNYGRCNLQRCSASSNTKDFGDSVCLI